MNVRQAIDAVARAVGVDPKQVTSVRYYAEHKRVDVLTKDGAPQSFPVPNRAAKKSAAKKQA
jgi:hypothetical protein